MFEEQTAYLPTDKRGGMSESDATGHDLVRSKKALAKAKRAETALKAASEARKRAGDLMILEAEANLIAGGSLSIELDKARTQGEQEAIASLEQQRQKHEESWSASEEAYRQAIAEEQKALDEMAEAQAELDEATVEPRVEGLKLRFETRKLQATLSAGIVVGVATITEVLLPPKPNYTWMLWLTYASFFASLYGALSDMQRLSFVVENTRISGTSSSEERRTEKWARRVREVALRGFFVGVVLFAGFVTLNLA